jgi:phosphoribosyl 1,2-cyclic phosphodiesterase
MMPSRLKSKISSIVERINRNDIESPEDRELFLARLPDYLFSTVGGNTSCVQISTDDEQFLVFDAGTGIRELGLDILEGKKKVDVHIFMSHFHWDHIQGFPFFFPAFDPRNEVRLYSPVEGFKAYFERQMEPPFFPITLAGMGGVKDFITLTSPIKFGDTTVRFRAMNHPGGCYSYSVSAAGKKAIYSTDTELQEADFHRSKENEEYFSDADALIIDTQYTLGEALEKYNWGHSSFSLAADFAASWKIKRLILFHHEPTYNDKKIHTILSSASWYIDHLEQGGTEVVLGTEGLELEV